MTAETLPEKLPVESSSVAAVAPAEATPKNDSPEGSVKPANVAADLPEATDASGEPVEESSADSPASAEFIAPAAPPPAPEFASAEEQQRYLELVQSLIEAGLGKVRSRDKAKASFEAAQSICANDPRLYYAYALSMRTTDRTQATRHLLTAMNQGAYAYPPAWRLLIDLELKKPLEPRVIKGLANFARRLEESSGAWPGEAGKAEFATYLGKIVGFWQGPAPEAKKFETEIAETDQVILKILPESRRHSYQLGKDEVLGLYDLLGQQASQQSAQAAADGQQAQSDAQRQVDNKQQELTDNEQKLSRTKEEYDKKWNDMKVEFQREWTTLETDLKVVVDGGRQVEASIERVEGQIQFWKEQLVSLLTTGPRGASGGTPNLQRDQCDREITRATLERGVLQLQHNTLQRQAYAIQIKAQARLAEMMRAEAEYQRATGQIVKESTLIADKRKSLTVQSDRISKRQARPERRAASVDLHRLGTYAPIDLEAEKARILESYSAFAK
jgi:hypothetical protein